jgi:hypothetical protein
MKWLRFWHRIPSNPFERLRVWAINEVWKLRGFRRIELPIGVRNRMKNDAWHCIETNGVRWWLDGREVLDK